MKSKRTLKLLIILAMTSLSIAASSLTGSAQSEDEGSERIGKRLFKRETFVGNGRTCATCHSPETGTVSPEDAQRRFAENPQDPLFLHDGTDDGQGNGVTRMLTNATILVEVPLADNVSLADEPTARSVFLRRGIPSTLNTPALDPVLMLDGREPDLETQALNAIRGHAQGNRQPVEKELRRIAAFEQNDAFFSSKALRKFARTGRVPELPQGVTESEKRGRRFFEDVPIDPETRAGSCAVCHSGPMLNQTNQFLPLPLAPGTRFQTVLVSEFNAAGNPVREFIFRNPDGTTTTVSSPDPGRALVTGDPRQFPGDSLNAFKIPSLWGVRRTAPYFHDNSAKSLEELVAHYKQFFVVISTPPGGGDPTLVLTDQDMADIVAYLKLLD
jgi:cytochrome c peroxidase